MSSEIITIDTGGLTTAQLQQAQIATEEAAAANAVPITDGETEQAEADAQSEEESAGGEEPKPRRKGGYQRTIERQAAENAELRAQLAQSSAGKSPITEDLNAPDPDKFETTAEYLKAAVRYELDRERNEAAKQTQFSKFEARAKQFASTVPDYAEVMADAALVSINPATQEFLTSQDSGPAVAYHLAKNPELAERLIGMSPVQTVVELAKLEATIAAGKLPNPAKTVPKASAAPKPIQPVSASASARAFDPRNMDMMTPQEYNAWRDSGGR